MKRKHKSLQNIIFVMAALAFVMACDDEAIPLRDPSDNEEQAGFTWKETADSLQSATYNTYLGTEGTFVQDNQGNTTFHYWWNSHMLDVLVDGYLRTGDENYVPRMKALVQGIKTKHGGTYTNDFNDDMQWLGNSCVRAYNATGDVEFKEVAEFVWEEIKKSWSDLYGGGITWKSNEPLGKNATSNAPAAILAMRLFEVDGNEENLQWAKDIYQWQKDILVDPASGLVWDNINEVDGEVVINKDWIFTYNIGTYIGAGLKLYEETGEQMYLREAVKTARSMMTSPKLTTEGLLRDEGQGDGGLFKGILVRYFTLLIQQPDLNDGDRKSFLDFMKFNAKTFYQKGIKRPAMLAGPNWREMPGDRTDLSTQLSGVMLMEAAAKLHEEGMLE
ncbi:glycosyl hydrolase family 76 [Sinomicrobium pectinilyticum]|uniref:Glycosyl hydrolase family 76 n=1 Tax=Sinomicrobium pectinilyticum TaxID=1084421 RepID=A0A3N0EA67_SINP1|nr:glycoside hydrolase family 76 protein [Sinomicrobium pectinilyticum]RNL84710.1 glycosyl hydrolase family 76 [Sinomicrobium pectinilyticum]